MSEVNLKKSKRGQPSKIHDELCVRFAAYLAGEGKTDEEIADQLGVTRITVHNWKTTYVEFFNTLKEKKEQADRKVEKSLFERANGYSHPEEKIFLSKDGEIIRAETTKHYPPDPTSIIFWLKNRQPDKWREKQKGENDATVTVTGEIKVAPVDVKDRVKLVKGGE